MDVLKQLLSVMEQLRDPENGCPWDKEQTFASLIPYTLEEAYEVVDAIDKEDFDELCSELGDLLFQVVFYAQIAHEKKLFNFNDVATAISAKLISRHPHVFADEKIDSVEQQSAAWDEHKRKERAKKIPSESAATSELDGVIKALPALSRAQKLQRRAARVGFDWDDIKHVYAKLHEEINEVKEAAESLNQDAIEDEVGDLIFASVNLARFLNVDAEEAARKGCLKFERRFRSIERKLSVQNKSMPDMSLVELEALWDQVKREEPPVS